MQDPANELRRIFLPRTWVNNTHEVYLPIRFIADSSLRASMHKSGQRCSVEPVWKGGCRGWLPEQLRNCLTRFRDKLCHLRDLLRLTDQFDRVEEAYAQAPLT